MTLFLTLSPTTWLGVVPKDGLVSTGTVQVDTTSPCFWAFIISTTKSKEFPVYIQKEMPSPFGFQNEKRSPVNRRTYCKWSFQCKLNLLSPCHIAIFHCCKERLRCVFAHSNRGRFIFLDKSCFTRLSFSVLQQPPAYSS